MGLNDEQERKLPTVRIMNEHRTLEKRRKDGYDDGPDWTTTEANVKWEDADKLKFLNSVALVLVEVR